MHRNIAIPDYRSLVTQTSWMDICQIGYDICEFDSLRGLGIIIIGRLHFDNRDRFAIWMGSIGKATEPYQQTSGCWHLTFDSFLNLDMRDDTNAKFLLLRVQTTYIWLRKWEVIVGGHDWSCREMWIWGGRGFVGVQRRSCYLCSLKFLIWIIEKYLAPSHSLLVYCIEKWPQCILSGADMVGDHWESSV